jgi:hypothetical protein
VSRRRFEHLVVEISLAVEQNIPRYRLWLQMHDLGWNPENLDIEEALSFCDNNLRIYLAECGLKMSSRSVRKLRREIGRFDPNIITPFERMAEI